MSLFLYHANTLYTPPQASTNKLSEISAGLANNNPSILKFLNTLWVDSSAVYRWLLLGRNDCTPRRMLPLIPQSCRMGSSRCCRACSNAKEKSGKIRSVDLFSLRNRVTKHPNPDTFTPNPTALVFWLFYLGYISVEEKEISNENVYV